MPNELRPCSQSTYEVGSSMRDSFCRNNSDDSDIADHNAQDVDRQSSSDEGPGKGVRRLSGLEPFADLSNFARDVVEDIGVYLNTLEGRKRVRLYDRNVGDERARWKHFVDTAHVKTEDGRLADHPASSDVGDCLVDCCRPPRDLPFQEQAVLPDGKPRLAFSACFESGNLSVAECDTPTSYTLYVDNDVNTVGYTQWFYFGTKGGLKGSSVSFRIVNLKKSGSLFESGMRPVVWSERSLRGWERGGRDIRYFATDKNLSDFYTLSFDYTFEYDDDTVFFAYHYPYTYSHLRYFLSTLEAKGSFVQRESLCKTVGGVDCELLRIQAPRQDQMPAEGSLSSVAQKPCAIVSGRVHPGESNASWMVHGFLQFLCSNDPEAAWLREAFDWVVIPMLNPDGVIRGNYRCGLAGMDLNRVYDRPKKLLHPTIWHLKNLFRERPVELFMDFHGHSKKEGIFFYGGAVAPEDDRNALIRLLPRLCSVNSGDFEWRRCRFNVLESKRTTARLVAFQELGVLRAYTIEASFSGASRPASASLTESAASAPGLVPQPPSELPVLGASRRPSKLSVLSASSRGSRRQSDFDGVDWPDEEGLNRNRRAWQTQHELAAEDATNFDPPRLRRAGSTVCQSVAAAWRSLDANEASSENFCSATTTTENAKAADACVSVAPSSTGTPCAPSAATAAREVVGREMAWLMKGKDPEDDSGSDSAPEAGLKSSEELKMLHRRLVVKIRKRRAAEEESAKRKAAEDAGQYRTVVAFGKTQKVYIKNDAAATNPCSPCASRPTSPPSTGVGDRRAAVKARNRKHSPSRSRGFSNLEADILDYAEPLTPSSNSSFYKRPASAIARVRADSDQPQDAAEALARIRDVVGQSGPMSKFYSAPDASKSALASDAPVRPPPIVIDTHHRTSSVSGRSALHSHSRSPDSRTEKDPFTPRTPGHPSVPWNTERASAAATRAAVVTLIGAKPATAATAQQPPVAQAASAAAAAPPQQDAGQQPRPRPLNLNQVQQDHADKSATKPIYNTASSLQTRDSIVVSVPVPPLSRVGLRGRGWEAPASPRKPPSRGAAADGSPGPTPRQRGGANRLRIGVTTFGQRGSPLEDAYSSRARATAAKVAQ